MLFWSTYSYFRSHMHTSPHTHTHIRVHTHTHTHTHTPQILLGLQYLHNECGVIHTDIKPENILLCVDEEYVRQLVSDGAKTRSAVSAAPKLSTSTKVRTMVDCVCTSTVNGTSSVTAPDSH